MTELTIDQALQQAVEAHKAGQVQEADRLYTAILKAQPKHPDANHNMGVLAVGVGKVELALPFLKTALEVNPNASQFWLSYIDALIKLERLVDAKATFYQAKSKGVKGDGFDKLEQRFNGVGHKPLEASKVVAEAPRPQPNILDSLKLDQAIKLAKSKIKDGFPSEAKKIYQDVLVKFPKNKRAKDGLMSLSVGTAGKASNPQEPPKHELQSLINLYNQGQFQQALGQTTKSLEQFPKSSMLFNICGAIYRKIGKLDASVETYTKALAIKPDYAEAYNNMGVTLQDQGKLDEAIDAYNNVLQIKPRYFNAHYNMGNALKDQGRLEEAIEAYNKALAIKPDHAGVQHMVSSLTGKTTTSAPKEYIETLFDGYSRTFEDSLVGNLEYKIPKLLTDIIVRKHGGSALGSVLDLGCGTGLTGLEIKGFCSNLEGIDLSKNMLELAGEKNVYDKLVHTDILDYLANTELCFDYFIATDVLIYVGDLTEFFRLIKFRNKKSGKLAFSTEKNDTKGFRLETSGRYSHSLNYIEGLCKQFGYSISYFSEIKLRKEKNRFLTGGLYILDF
ncbi:tetratricopeptide repeat protein [Planktomarina temperata]|nr:tetratricopeptide repeat protein [Planktomarina temperata]